MSDTTSELTEYPPQARAAAAPSPKIVSGHGPSGPATSGTAKVHEPKPAGPRKPTRERRRSRIPDATDYHNERRRYLARIRRHPGLRQRYLRTLIGYLLLRCAWSFGFFPVVLAFWVPLVLAEFNPVVMVQSLLPHLENFVASNPEVQARVMGTLVTGWVSVGLFFLLFDVVINPFHSPFQKEADIHMRAWSQSQGLVPPDEM